jgi:glyoxylase I family protein
MNLPINFHGIHHFALSVTDMDRSLAFYQRLGFKKVMDLGSKVIIGNESLVVGLETSADAGDHFNPHRVGLDHLSFVVNSMADLEAAMAYFNDQDIAHGEITDLSEHGLPMLILPFFDPDGIALEFTLVLA